jgi:mannose-6-phosphate isomerase-like protein (cupin superfamily)
MIRRLAELTLTPKLNVRGGVGPAQGAAYLAGDDMAGVLAAGRTVLAAGSSIGEHSHPDTEELYLILDGQGRGVLDGRSFPVAAGDLFVVKAGHSHGLINDSDATLTYFGLMTPKA